MYQAIEQETITVGALGVRFLVESDDSNGTASVFECYVPANSRMPAPHSHDGFEETIYGLQGTTTWTIDGRTVEVRPGEAVCVQRGQVHGFENHGDADATLLPRWASAPTKIGRFEVRRELFAGLTTFMAMAYIVVVNPRILSEGGQIFRD